MQIRPQNLRRLRKARGLSRRELAHMSNISQKQIQRLEDPNQTSKNVRGHTIRCLAKSLDVKIEELVKSPQVPGFKVTRTRISLLPGVRLAYDLIERRYGVAANQLIQMAPLFFTLLAEGSLTWRAAQLQELRQAIDKIREMGDDRRRCAWHALNAEYGSGYEQDAITRGDLFNDPYPHDYEFEPMDEWDGSPFADYLRHLAKEIGKPEVLDLEGYATESVMGFGGLPSYSVCRADLARIVSVDSRAAHALHASDARLSDIPEPLMAESAADTREAWLEDRLSSESKEWLATLADIRNSIDENLVANESTPSHSNRDKGSEV